MYSIVSMTYIMEFTQPHGNYETATHTFSKIKSFHQLLLSQLPVTHAIQENSHSW